MPEPKYDPVTSLCWLQSILLQLLVTPFSPAMAFIPPRTECQYLCCHKPAIMSIDEALVNVLPPMNGITPSWGLLQFCEQHIVEMSSLYATTQAKGVYELPESVFTGFSIYFPYSIRISTEAAASVSRPTIAEIQRLYHHVEQEIHAHIQFRLRLKHQHQLGVWPYFDMMIRGRDILVEWLQGRHQDWLDAFYRGSPSPSRSPDSPPRSPTPHWSPRRSRPRNRSPSRRMSRQHSSRVRSRSRDRGSRHHRR